MKTHELKTWPTYFARLLDGTKTFEARKDDRGFDVGDNLRLREWESDAQRYTGRETTRKISYILRDSEHIAPGYCILGLLDTATAALRAERDEAMREAKWLATLIWRSEYKDTAPDWQPLDTGAGIISQIDNMYAGVRSQRDAALAQLAQVTRERDEWRCSARLYQSELRDLAEGRKVETQLGFPAEQIISALRADKEILAAALVRLRDCDFVITPHDRMDAVRDIARAALDAARTP